jgi:hypothetical protein
MPVIRDSLFIRYPGQGQTIHANSLSVAMVAVSGDCGTSKTVTVSMTASGPGTATTTVVSKAVPTGTTWMTAGFSLESGQNCTAYATNGDVSDTKSFRVV